MPAARPAAPAALLAALLAGSGCPEEAPQDDDSATEPPEDCDSFSLQNVAFRFEIVFYEQVYGVEELLEILAYYGLDAAEFSLTGVVSDHGPSGEEELLRIEFVDPYSGDVYGWVDTVYTLAEGFEVPVQVGQTIAWRIMINNRGGVLKLATQLAEEDGCLLFYAEPGRRAGVTGPGIAYDNLDEFSQSRVFASTAPVDHDCPFTFETPCGDQYNLALRFQVTGGEAVEVFPGQSERFTFTEDGGEEPVCTADFEVTNVWSYDWRDVDLSCPDPDGVYERDFAFFVTRASE